MRVSVFGLGYVGSVSAACLAESGNEVIGIDPNATKVDLINDGRSPVIETGLDDLIAANVAAGRLRAVRNGLDTLPATDLSLVCVGTPSRNNGSLDLRYLERVSKQIGETLRGRDDFHVVVIRSTMLPGTMKSLIVPTLETASGKRAGVDFGVCNNPEFLREATAVHDYHNPPKTVIGATDPRSADLLAGLYRDLDAPLIRTSIEVAEMVKYTDNAWHALKVGFANEIGNIAKELAIDSHEVMEIFCQDTKLNLSPYYLKPGFAFGGSCLPKDLRALTYAAKHMDLDVPILNSVLESNRVQVQRGLEFIVAGGGKKVGVLGLSFKAGTDDLRESPMVEVVETLIGKGYDLQVFDRNVKLNWLMGANREYVESRIPHIARLMVDGVESVLDHADVVVIGNDAPEFRDVAGRLKDHQRLVDLVRAVDGSALGERYLGICW
jgi:GDP-mannose 6-dehydrogenase